MNVFFYIFAYVFFPELDSFCLKQFPTHNGVIWRHGVQEHTLSQFNCWSQLPGLLLASSMRYTHSRLHFTAASTASQNQSRRAAKCRRSIAANSASYKAAVKQQSSISLMFWLLHATNWLCCACACVSAGFQYLFVFREWLHGGDMAPMEGPSHFRLPCSVQLAIGRERRNYHGGHFLS